MYKHNYIIYHIPGKKVGISRNLKKRLAEQGYKIDQVEILGNHDNCINALRRERELSKQFNYKSDGFFHPNMFNMTYKTHEGNTIGFPVAFEDFNDWLEDHPSITLSTMNSDIGANRHDDTYRWLIKNKKKSKFPDGKLKTFIYCEALEVFTKDSMHETKIEDNGNIGLEIFDKIRSWASDRGIIPGGRLETQALKLGEEFGELQKAILKDDKEEVKDAIGDIVVVLTSIAYFNGDTIEDCIESAYNVISKRKGSMNKKGDFIKDTL